MKPVALKLTKGYTPPPPVSEWVKRHGDYPKGTVLPETRVQTCPPRKVSDFPKGFIPAAYYERNLEQNQLLASCCRHPENHEISAWKSHPDEKRPDSYELDCTCGKKHRVFCVGLGDERPEWK